jgi:hypothetical protein
MADIIDFPNSFREHDADDSDDILLSFGIDIFDDSTMSLVTNGLNKQEIDMMFNCLNKIIQNRIKNDPSI